VEVISKYFAARPLPPGPSRMGMGRIPKPAEEFVSISLAPGLMGAGCLEVVAGARMLHLMQPKAEPTE